MGRPVCTFFAALGLAAALTSTPALAGDKCTDAATARCNALWQQLGYPSLSDCRRDLIEGTCIPPDPVPWDWWCYDNPPGYADVCILWPV